MLPRLLLLGALLGAIAWPGAHAQLPVSPGQAQLNVFVDDPGRTMVPNKTEMLDIGLNYAVPAGSQPTPDPNNNDTSAQPTHITFTAKTVPAWVLNVTFLPPVVNVSVPLGTAGQQFSAKAKAVLFIDPKAPALDKREFVITATAAPNGNIASASGESPPINIKPAFVAKANVTAPTSIVVHGGRWTNMPFTITNLGNGNDTMKLNVTARPQDSQVEYPPTINVSAGGSTIVNVRLRVPWTYGESGSLDFEATPLAGSDDSQDGRPVHASIDVNGQSAVPGPGLPALVLSAAGLALLLRRR